MWLSRKLSVTDCQVTAIRGSNLVVKGCGIAGLLLDGRVRGVQYLRQLLQLLHHMTAVRRLPVVQGQRVHVGLLCTAVQMDCTDTDTAVSNRR